MFNSEEFLNNFIEAAKNDDAEAMAKLADSISNETLEFRTNLLSDLVDALRDSQANKEVEAGLSATLQLMKLAVEAKEAEAGEEKDSTAEEAKDNTKAEEVTQDVAADGSATEAKGDSGQLADAATETEAEVGGEAPAKEEEEVKSEDDKS